PQLAGGLVFGAGFAIAGLCPGTSCVAAGSGRGGGRAVMAGMFAGALLAGFVLTPLGSFYGSGARGVFTLPEILPLSYGAVVAAGVAVGLPGLPPAQRIEKRA